MMADTVVSNDAPVAPATDPPVELPPPPPVVEPTAAPPVQPAAAPEAAPAPPDANPVILRYVGTGGAHTFGSVYPLPAASLRQSDLDHYCNADDPGCLGRIAATTIYVPMDKAALQTTLDALTAKQKRQDAAVQRAATSAEKE